MYRVFAFLRRQWVAAGEPFPGVIRFVRYNMFGRIWPVYRTANNLCPPTDLPPPEVAVIIPCHNYGHFLREAIESVLAQTVKPVDVLVVDDASDDDTAAIARSYADQGVRLLQVNHRSLALTRNSGAAATHSAYLLYLDADDRLPKKYIQRCLDVMTEQRIGIAYPDRALFGASNLYVQSPSTFSEGLLLRNNFISSHALILRQAFDVVGGYRKIEGILEDWDFYRRVIAVGYTARRARTAVQYRMHSQSMGYTLRKSPEYTYARAAALAYHPTTIFTAFSGDIALFEEHLNGLRNLQGNPQYIHLHWYNMSADPAFDARLRAATGTLPFQKIIYTQSTSPSSDTNNPLRKMQAYNNMIRTCDTGYVLALEEDIRIRPDTLTSLLDAMDGDLVAVIAPCKKADSSLYNMWHRREDNGVFYPHQYQSTGTEFVWGADMACTLFRLHPLRMIVPLCASATQSWEHVLYQTLIVHGRIICNWKSEVERIPHL